MIYHYQALNSKGETVSDFLDAPSEQAARSKIRSLGFYVVRINKQDVSSSTSSGDKKPDEGLRKIFSTAVEYVNIKLSAKLVGIFTRQLTTLLKAGMPLMAAITDIIDQIENKSFRHIIIDIKEKLEEGLSLSNALLRHRAVFSDMYINMVRVGENLGSLDEVTARLADIEEKRNALAGKVRAALWYPAFMFLFAIGVLVFLMVNVIPNIAEMFKSQNRELPLPTAIVIATSDFLSSYWYVIPLLVFIIIYLYNRMNNNPEGKKKIDEIKLNLPIIKHLYLKIIVLKFTQNLGILLNNKVDIIKSFDIVQKIVGNVIIEEKIAEAAVKIKEGSTVSNALQKGNFLPRLVLGMISAGEASDNLDKMLLNIAGVYESEIDLAVSSLTSLLEPIIIIIMGVMIGTIVVSVMLPIMQMNLLVQ